MREMKNSGIEWIGEIPAEWGVFPARYAFSEVKTKNTSGEVKNALQFKFGTIIPKSNFDADNEDYVADTITNYTIVEPRTIMINGLNLNYDLKSLRVGLVHEKGVITSAYLALKPDENIINAEFANYLFKGYESKMAFHNMGAGIRLTLGFKEFKNQPILVPEMAEQLKIIDFLDNACAEIDTVIEKTKATIEEYKKLKQSVITQAVTKGIRPNRPMKDSGIEWIGEIPVGWNVSKVKNECKCLDNLREPISAEQRQRNNPIYDYYGASGVIDKIDFYNVDDEVLLIGEDGANLVMRNLPLIYKAKGKFWVNNHAHILKPFIHNDYNYLAFLLEAGDYTNYITGSAQPKLSQEKIMNYPIVRVPLIEQQEIADYLDKKCSEIDELIAKKTSLLSELESYKKSLIYEYVTGKISDFD